MPRRCSVCTHPERPAIDRALVAGESVPALSAQTGVSQDALKRHRQGHLPVALLQRQALAEARGVVDLARTLAVVHGAALAVLDAAQRDGRPETALRAVDRLLATATFVVRLHELVDADALAARLDALEAALAAQTSTNAGNGVPRWPVAP